MTIVVPANRPLAGLGVLCHMPCTSGSHARSSRYILPDVSNGLPVHDLQRTATSALLRALNCVIVKHVTDRFVESRPRLAETGTLFCNRQSPALVTGAAEGLTSCSTVSQSG